MDVVRVMRDQERSAFLENFWFGVANMGKYDITITSMPLLKYRKIFAHNPLVYYPLIAVVQLQSNIRS